LLRGCTQALLGKQGVSNCRQAEVSCGVLEMVSDTSLVGKSIVPPISHINNNVVNTDTYKYNYTKEI